MRTMDKFIYSTTIVRTLQNLTALSVWCNLCSTSCKQHYNFKQNLFRVSENTVEDMSPGQERINLAATK
jgi:hypothetical protein